MRRRTPKHAGLNFVLRSARARVVDLVIDFAFLYVNRRYRYENVNGHYNTHQNKAQSSIIEVIISSNSCRWIRGVRSLVRANTAAAPGVTISKDFFTPLQCRNTAMIHLRSIRKLFFFTGQIPTQLRANLCIEKVTLLSSYEIILDTGTSVAASGKAPRRHLIRTNQVVRILPHENYIVRCVVFVGHQISEQDRGSSAG